MWTDLEAALNDTLDDHAGIKAAAHARGWGMAGKIAENKGYSVRMIKKGLYLAAGEASMEALMAYWVEACL